MTVAVARPPLEPIRSDYRVRFLDDEQLGRLQDATLEVLERVGVRFPSDKALAILADHGAQVDRDSQIVRFPRDLVRRALASAPRYYTMAARDPAYDLHLEDGVSYFTTDGCGVATLDWETRVERPSTKADVAEMARIADYLPSIGFMWPTVSAQDHGRTSQLHEIDAAFNNTVKHFEGMVMGERQARHAVEMATVIAGSREALRERPVFSDLICSIAPLVQDDAGIEASLVFAEAGIPVGFLAMPTMGTTSPATSAGSLVVGDAEVISAIVLLQLAYPGAPVFHSIMKAWADPRTGGYVGYALDNRARYAPVEMAHHWGLPSMAACFGTDSKEAGTWQAGVEVALDPFLAGLTSPEIVTGLGLDRTYTLLVPEAIVLDDDIYQRARYALMAAKVDDETLAVDVIAAVGPGGHYLYEPHTRTHMRTSMVRAVTHELGEGTGYRDPVEVAREKVAWIRANHHPEPLEPAQQAELARILAVADAEEAR
ncbi:MAG TPA: trimethylamine methyltransferase family protein [Candidatus Limnocylindrales bacterium]|nr:trimethylamine methyltransferase family protein [Candidatus Limnocylindrales bacterium]